MYHQLIIEYSHFISTPDRLPSTELVVSRWKIGMSMLINAGQKLCNNLQLPLGFHFATPYYFPTVWDFGVLGESGFGICSIVVCVWVLGFWHLGVVTKCDCGKVLWIQKSCNFSLSHIQAKRNRCDICLLAKRQSEKPLALAWSTWGWEGRVTLCWHSDRRSSYNAETHSSARSCLSLIGYYPTLSTSLKHLLYL